MKTHMFDAFPPKYIKQVKNTQGLKQKRKQMVDEFLSFVLTGSKKSPVRGLTQLKTNIADYALSVVLRNKKVPCQGPNIIKKHRC